MLATLVMTVIGPDRPGLVQLLATRVADHGGNWLESRMCRHGGQFAGLLRVEVAEEQSDALRRALAGLKTGTPDWLRAQDIVLVSEDEVSKLKKQR